MYFPVLLIKKQFGKVAFLYRLQAADDVEVGSVVFIKPCDARERAETADDDAADPLSD